MDLKWFNPLFFILKDLSKDETIRTILVYGGKSSSKTISIAQFLTIEAYATASNTIAFRKETATIQTTLKKSFKLAIDSTRLTPAYESLLFSFRTVKGSEIVLKGLDTEEKAKGIESYKYLYLDELNHFAKEEFQQFNLSLRGMPGQKIFASWNPVSEMSWVKKDLIDNYEFVETGYKLPCPASFVKISTCGKLVLIKTTFEDNYWVAGSPCGTYGFRDNNLIAEYEKLQTTDYYSYRVNVLGEWGVRRTGGEFWKQFDEKKHIKELEVEQGVIHISLDENVNPYVTVSCWQVDTVERKIKQVHEIPCKSPDNNAVKAARQLIRWFETINYKDVVFIYGDPSASKRSTIDANNRSFYDKFIETLKIDGYQVVNKVMRSAPEIALSASFINDIYESNYLGWGIEVSSKCQVSIQDYLMAKEDADGRMLKPKEKNKETGVTFESVGHFSDAKRYFITTLLASEFQAYKVRGKRRGSFVHSE